MPLKNLENPQVYNVIHKELLLEQVSIDVKSAVQNSPGSVPVTYPSGGVELLLEVLQLELMLEMVWKCLPTVLLQTLPMLKELRF